MQEPIRTRPDGSIDTQFYIARGRQSRADAARAMVTRQTGHKGQRKARAMVPLCVVMVAALVLLPMMI